MIYPGRPTNGYSDIENLFYILNRELDNAFSILKINIENSLKSYKSEVKKLKELESKFQKTIQQNREKYIAEGEDADIANAIALSDAQNEYNIDVYYFEFQSSNLELIKQLSIDSLCKSTMVMLYSTIEYFMIEICANLKEKLPTKIGLEDLSGNGYIGTCFIYLEKVIDINYDKNEYENKFKEFQLIRNKIVHSNSSIVEKGNMMAITGIVNRKNSGLIIEENRFIFKSIHFVELFLKSSKKILNSLESNIEMKLNFPSLLHELKYKLGSSRIFRDNEEIKVIDNKIVYHAKISRMHKNSYGEMSITIETSKNSLNNLMIEKLPDFLTTDDIEKYYEDTKQRVRNSLKKHLNLINGKRNVSYKMRIH